MGQMNNMTVEQESNAQAQGRQRNSSDLRSSAVSSYRRLLNGGSR